MIKKFQQYKKELIIVGATIINSWYEFMIVHRSGRQHSNADTLSRRLCFQCQRLEPVTSVLHVNWKKEPVSPSTVIVAATNTVDGVSSPENSLNIVSH